MSTEKVHFKIGLSGHYWDKQPEYSILFNEAQVIEKTIISTASDEVFYVEFDQEIEEGPCVLKIRLENKDWHDTIQNEDKTEILKDMLLHIDSVEIDEIQLGHLIFAKSQFIGDDAERPILDKCLDLGWNGTWQLQFESPFYIWLLENI